MNISCAKQFFTFKLKLKIDTSLNLVLRCDLNKLYLFLMKFKDASYVFLLKEFLFSSTVL